MWNQAFVILALPDSWLLPSIVNSFVMFMPEAKFLFWTPNTNGVEASSYPRPVLQLNAWLQWWEGRAILAVMPFPNSCFCVRIWIRVSPCLTKKILESVKWLKTYSISHWLFSHWLSLGRLVGSGWWEPVQFTVGRWGWNRGGRKRETTPQTISNRPPFFHGKTCDSGVLGSLNLGKRNHMHFEVRPIRAPVTKSICWGLCWKRDACIGLDQSQVFFFWNRFNPLKKPF